MIRAVDINIPNISKDRPRIWALLAFGCAPDRRLSLAFVAVDSGFALCGMGVPGAAYANGPIMDV